MSLKFVCFNLNFLNFFQSRNLLKDCLKEKLFLKHSLFLYFRQFQGVTSFIQKLVGHGIDLSRCLHSIAFSKLSLDDQSSDPIAERAKLVLLRRFCNAPTQNLRTGSFKLTDYCSVILLAIPFKSDMSG